MKSTIDMIYMTVLPTMKEAGIEDTAVNRHLYLLNIREAWLRDGEDGIENSPIVITLTTEICRLGDLIPID